MLKFLSHFVAVFITLVCALTLCIGMSPAVAQNSPRPTGVGITVWAAAQEEARSADRSGAPGDLLRTKLKATDDEDDAENIVIALIYFSANRWKSKDELTALIKDDETSEVALHSIALHLSEVGFNNSELLSLLPASVAELGNGSSVIDATWGRRFLTVKILTLSNDRRAASVLESLLWKEDDPSVISLILNGLGDLEPAGLTSLLIDAVSKGRVETRAEALKRLQAEPSLEVRVIEALKVSGSHEQDPGVLLTIERMLRKVDLNAADELLAASLANPSNSDVRQSAAEELGSLGGKAATDLLKVRLSAEQDVDVVSSILSSLRKIDPSATTTFIQALNSDQSAVRLSAAEELGKLQNASLNVTSALVDRYELENDPDVVGSIISSLRLLNRTQSDVVLFKAMGNKDPRIRSVAAGELSNLTPLDKVDATPLIQSLLRQEHDGEVAIKLLQAIEEVSPEDAPEALKSALQVGNAGVRLAAANLFSSAKFDSPALDAALLATIDRDEDFEVVSAALDTAVDRGLRSNPSITDLGNWLTDPRPQMRNYAAKKLGTLGSEVSVLPTLRGQLKNESVPIVLQSLLNALNRIEKPPVMREFPSSVDIKNGNFTRSWDDVNIRGAGFDLKLRRTYNSRSNFEGMFGRSWCSSFETTVNIDAAGDVIQTECGAGSQTIFSPKGRMDKSIADFVDVVIAKSKASKGGETSPSRAGLLIDRTRRDLVASKLGVQRGIDYNQVYFADGRGPYSASVISGKLVINEANVTKYFSLAGKLLKMEDSNGNFLSLSYNTEGRVDEVDNEANNWLRFEYDALGHVAFVTSSLGFSATYAYAKDGRLADVRTKYGDVKYTYNSEGDLKTIDEGNGNLTELKIDPISRWINQLVDVKSGCAASYSYPKIEPAVDEYKIRGDISCADGGASHMINYFTFALNEEGTRRIMRSSRSLTADSQVTVQYHPIFQQPVDVVIGDQESKYIYNASGQLISIDDPSKPIRGFVYDATCRKPTEIMSSGKRFRFGYDSSCNLAFAVKEDGSQLSLSYDEQGRIAAISGEQSVFITYEQQFGKPAEVQALGIGKIVVSYGENGEIAKVDSPDGPEVALKVASVFNNLLDIVHEADTSDVQNRSALKVNCGCSSDVYLFAAFSDGLSSAVVLAPRETLSALPSQ